jgi:hypothetical protein
MRKSMKTALAVAAAATFALGTALPAAAGTASINNQGCSVIFANSTSTDFATSNSTAGGCGTLRVRHYYTTPGFSGYTGWVTGTTRVAQTGHYPELSSSQHQYTIMGSTNTYNLPA